MAADDPQLHFSKVAHATTATVQDAVRGEWLAATPVTAGDWSAVGYFFAQELRRRVRVPVGVIQSSWGGTPAETLMSLGALEADSRFARHVAAWKTALAKYDALQTDPSPKLAYREALAAHLALRDQVPDPQNPDPIDVPSPSRRPSTPTVLFNAMIAPLVPYVFRDVIWYQGEADVRHAVEYEHLFPALIRDWRAHWEQGDFPFLFVQLANWERAIRTGDNYGFADPREAQTKALALPRTSMAVTIDIGDPADVHPRNKRDVGRRLALAARRVAYGEEVVASGPLFRECRVEHGAVRVFFNETGSGLVMGQSPGLPPGVKPFPSDRLIGFALRGRDGSWIDADARIEGETVVVYSSAVPEPAAVRYAWANSPRGNLYNREGLPASPFRSDP